MKVCIHTFGCQMNKLDSELTAAALVAAGHTLAAAEAEADAIIFNTCSVRDHAEQRVLSRVRQLEPHKRRNPRLLIGIMGCFAQRLGRQLFDLLPQLDLVCGTRQFHRLPALLESAESGKALAVEEAGDAPPTRARPLHAGAQAFVTVMRGCNNFCSYCIVPYVRGREQSRPAAEIVAELRDLASRGTKEVTLLGQNIDAYGKDLGSDLADLLEAAAAVEGIARIRFVTSHPRDVTAKLLETVNRLPKVCRHLHMPAQSGSTRVLKAMRRGYSREEYDEKLRLASELAPGMLVASDFIVGFPGETNEDFAQTLELVKQAGFQNSYIFKYSPRPGTRAAATLPDDVPEAVKKTRNQALLAAQERVSLARSASLVGSRQTVMVEGPSPRDPRKLIGRTDTNLICVFDAPASGECAPGEFAELLIENATALTLFGRRA